MGGIGYSPDPPMPLVHIKTYGCQMNERDTEQVSQMFVERGYTMTARDEDADVVLINTSSVRDQAEQKALGKMGMVRRRRTPLHGRTRPSVTAALFLGDDISVATAGAHATCWRACAGMRACMPGERCSVAWQPCEPIEPTRWLDPPAPALPPPRPRCRRARRGAGLGPALLLWSHQRGGHGRRAAAAAAAGAALRGAPPRH